MFDINEILKPKTFEEIEENLKNAERTFVITYEDLNYEGLRKTNFNIDIYDLMYDARLRYIKADIVVFKKHKQYKILKNRYNWYDLI
jgi:lysine/ornithine N-monooxygenase